MISNNFQGDLENLKAYIHLTVLDNMIKAFFTKFPLAQINSKPSDYFDKKTKYKIKYQDVLTYHQATISNHYHSLGTLDEERYRQLTIKLSHNGFIYTGHRYLHSSVKTLKRPIWFDVGEKVLSDMPFLEKLKQESNAHIKFLYNVRLNQIDINFFKDTTVPFMMITFEHGNPIDLPHLESAF